MVGLICLVQTTVGVVSPMASLLHPSSSIVLQVDTPWQMQVVTDILEPLPFIPGFHLYHILKFIMLLLGLETVMFLIHYDLAKLRQV